MKIKDVDSLTEQQIDELKRAYGKLFKVTVCGTKYLCRLMYRSDIEAIAKVAEKNIDVSNLEVDEKVVSLCVLGPTPPIEEGGWAAMPAGIIPTLSSAIRRKSGFVVYDEDAPAEEKLYEDEEVITPTPEELEVLQMATGYKLHGIRFEDAYFVVRPITRIEFKEMMNYSEPEQDEIVVKKACLWPANVDWDSVPAGYINSIVQYVMSYSGFAGPIDVEDI